MHTTGIKAILWFRAMLQTAVLISFCASIPIKTHYSPENSIFHQGQLNIFANAAPRVIESKGVSSEDNGVGWIDSLDTFTATTSEAKDLKLFWIILLGLGGIGLLISGLVLSGKLPNWQELKTSIRPKHLSIPSSPGFDTKYCPHCGNLNPLKAEFCTKCGKIFPT